MDSAVGSFDASEVVRTWSDTVVILPECGSDFAYHMRADSAYDIRGAYVNDLPNFFFFFLFVSYLRLLALF